MFALFRAARALFVLQGLAFGCAALAGAVGVAAFGAPPELQSIAVAGLAVGVLFGLSGFVLGMLMRRATAGPGDARLTGRTVEATLGGLSCCAIAAAVASQELPGVWTQAAGWLGDIGFVQAIGRGADPFAGILVLPVVLALWVPVLVTTTALVSIGAPLVLAASIALQGVRGRHRVTLTAHCQGALALGSWIAQFAFSQLGELVKHSMVTSGDAEVVALAGEMTAAVGELTRTATFLLVPALGMAVLATLVARAVSESVSEAAGVPAVPGGLSGVPGVSGVPGTLAHPAEPPSTRRSTVGPDASPGRSVRVDDHVNDQRDVSDPASRSIPRPSARPSVPEVPASAHTARAAMAALGALFLCFSACDSLRARPSFERAVPAPATSIATPPSTIEITFSDEIDPSAVLYLTRLPDPGRTASGGSPDAIAQPIAVTMVSARQGEGQRTLRAVTRSLTRGLYHVAWTAQPAHGGVGRRGSFSFGVGIAVPPDDDGVVHTLQEADSGARYRRLTLVGGVLLLVLGFVLPRLSQSL